MKKCEQVCLTFQATEFQYIFRREMKNKENIGSMKSTCSISPFQGKLSCMSLDISSTLSRDSQINLNSFKLDTINIVFIVSDTINMIQ